MTKDYFKTICEALFKAYNKNPKANTFSVRTGTLFKAYVTGIPYQPDEFLAFRTAVEKGIEQNLWEASFRKPENVYITITSTNAQAQAISRILNCTTMPMYTDAMTQKLSEYKDSSSAQVKAWVEKELAKLDDVCRWFPFSPDKTPCEQTSELEVLLNTVTYISQLKEDMMERVLSCQFCNGSKEFERKYMRAASKILDPELYAIHINPSDILEQFHVLSNPPDVMIRGYGIIYFKNGEKITIRPGLGHLSLSGDYIANIKDVDSLSLLSIENPTTFHDYTPSPGQTLVCTMGYPSHVVTDFINSWLAGKDIRTFVHYGDLDAFGFHILYKLHERTSAKVVPLHMDMRTYEANKVRAVELNSKNQELFRKLSALDYFSEETKTLFEHLMRENKLLEQEAIILQ